MQDPYSKPMYHRNSSLLKVRTKRIEKAAEHKMSADGKDSNKDKQQGNN